MDNPLLDHALPGDIMGHYILVGQQVKQVDLMTWAAWFEQHDRHVGLTLLYKGGVRVRVSTVFLGLPHDGYAAIPCLFETMVFGGPHDEVQFRYTTYALAAQGHQLVVAGEKDLLNFGK